MVEDYLVSYAAPALAGIKTGNIFSVAYTAETLLPYLREVADLDRRLRSKGLHLLTLRITGKTLLLYLYRSSRLRRDLADADAARLLKEAGYESEGELPCLCELIRRLNRAEEFPHEIGLFLSYPPEDVRGFICNKGQNCKCIGCWKVYGDLEASQETFRRYKECTRIYCRRRACGTPLEDLAIAG